MADLPDAGGNNNWWIGAAGGIIGAVFTGLAIFWDKIKTWGAKDREAKAKAKEDEQTWEVRNRAGTIVEWQAIAEDLRTQLKAALARDESKQDIIDEVCDAQTDCELWAVGASAWMLNVYHHFRTPGAKLEDMPEPPAPRQPSRRSGYLKRKSQQVSEISKVTVANAIAQKPGESRS